MSRPILAGQIRAFIRHQREKLDPSVLNKCGLTNREVLDFYERMLSDVSDDVDVTRWGFFYIPPTVQVKS